MESGFIAADVTGRRLQNWVYALTLWSENGRTMMLNSTHWPISLLPTQANGCATIFIPHAITGRWSC